MADEAVIVTLLGNAGDVIELNVNATTAIPKGSLMYLSASGTALITDGVEKIFCGIAAVEKTNSDGKTKMSLITHCIATLTCGAAESMGYGEPVMTGAAANEVDICGAGAGYDPVEDRVKVVGIALNDVAGDGTGDVLINVGKSH